MNFLFHRHKDGESVTVHCDEPLPHRLPDIPGDEDSTSERTEKQIMLHHTQGGHLIQRAQAEEDWVEKPYRNLLAVRGIAAVRLLDCYTVVLHKGAVFDWDKVLVRVPQAICDGLSGEVVGEVEDMQCPDCFGPGQKRTKKKDGAKATKHNVEGDIIETFVNQVVERAEALGTFICCVVEHPTGGAVCGVRLPKAGDAGREEMACTQASLSYDSWAEKKQAEAQATTTTEENTEEKPAAVEVAAAAPEPEQEAKQA